MYNFTTETQGVDTFRVCEMSEAAQLDTAGLGMLLNNKIAGLCPVSSIQIDNKRFIRYNISSQITLKQFFMDKVDKKRFLTILNNILTSIENIEEYMLEPEMLLLEKDEIYVNVGTLHTDLIYYPVIEARKSFDICSFVKNLIMSTEFDPNEQDNYVTLLISFLNRTDRVSIAELKEYIVTLLKGIKAEVRQQPVQPAAMPIMPENIPVSVPMQQPQRMSQEPYRGPVMPNQAPMPNHTGFAVPGQAVAEEPAKKKGFFSMLTSKPKKEKVKKEKPAKVEKKSKNKDIVTPSGMVIPNMDNTKNSTLPQPPKPAGAPSLQQIVMPQPQIQQPVMPQPQIQQPVMSQPQIQQPVMPQPQIQQPVMPQPQVQQPVMPQPQVQQPIMPQTSYASTESYGETVVLGTETAGETTVLNAGYNTVQKQRNPYIIRKKTNEKIEINKNLFRIGKEKNYVDYCITDNTAVSRSHADIIRKNNEFYIVDNNSLNHTFLNNKQIPSSQMQKLEDYMVIKLADELFEFRL